MDRTRVAVSCWYICEDSVSFIFFPLGRKTLQLLCADCGRKRRRKELRKRRKKIQRLKRRSQSSQRANSVAICAI